MNDKSNDCKHTVTPLLKFVDDILQSQNGVCIKYITEDQSGFGKLYNFTTKTFCIIYFGIIF